MGAKGLRKKPGLKLPARKVPMMTKRKIRMMTKKNSNKSIFTQLKTLNRDDDSFPSAANSLFAT